MSPFLHRTLTSPSAVGNPSSGGFEAVLLDEVARHRLRALRGAHAPLAGLDDRALHQDVERPGDLVAVTQARLFGERPQHGADVLEVIRTRPPDRMIQV